MKLLEYSKEQNITYKTAWNRFKAGKIPGAYLDSSGHIIIPNPKNDNSSKTEWADL